MSDASALKSLPKKSGLPRATGLSRSTSRESIASNVSAVSGAAELNWAVGDRCSVGDRIGTIAYIGTTRFGPGEWVGVVCDEPVGKNDGAVQGHRYFDCTPHHGLFCKAGKLDRLPHDGKAESTAKLLMTPRANSEEPAQSPLSPFGGDTSPLHTSTPERDVNPYALEFGFDIGDRVIVSGNKVGLVRFLGTAEFAQGVWVGVELDQPLGKNDGSVQGHRYFVCKPRYGLFAPAAKTVRAPNQSGIKLKVRHTKTSALRQRTGSQESLSSMSSFQSMASGRAKVRLGTSAYLGASPAATPLHGRVQRPTIIPSSHLHSTTINTLQDSLREKEQHVEQLIRERDMERSEMARISQRCEAAEQRLSEVMSGVGVGGDDGLQAQIAHLKTQLENIDKERHRLSDLYDEEKKKADDLQFRIEEESILRAELETRMTELQSGDAKMADSKSEVDVLKARLETAEKKSNDLGQQLSDGKQQEIAFREQLLKLEAENAKAAKLMERNETLEAELKTHVNELAASKSKSEEQGRLCLKLENEVKNLMTKVETSERDLSTVKQRIESVQSEKDALEKVLVEKSGATAEQSGLVEKKNKELTDLRNEIEVLRQQVAASVAEAKAQAEAANAQMESMKVELKNEKDAKAALQSALDERIASAQNSQLEMQQQLQLSNTKLAELQQSLDSSSTELTAWTEKHKNWESERANLQTEIGGLKAAQQTAADAIVKQLTEQNQSLTDDLNASRSQVTALELSAKEAAAAMEAMVADKNVVFVAKTELENELAVVRAQLDSRTSECAALSDQCAQLRANEAAIGEKSASTQTELANANQQLAATLKAATDELENKQKEVATLTEERTNMQQQIETMQSNLLAVKSQLESVSAEASTLQIEKQSWDADRSRLQADIDSLKLTQQLKADGVVKHLTEEKDALAVEYAAARETLQSTMVEKETLLRQIAEITSQAATLRDQLLEQTKLSEEKLNAVGASLTEMKSKSESLDSERQALLQTKTEMEQKLIAQDSAVAQLRTQCDEHQRTIEQLNKNSNDSKENNEMELNAFKLQSQNQIEQLSKELEKSRSAGGNADSQVVALNEQNSELLKAHKELEKTLTETKEQLNVVMREREELQQLRDSVEGHKQQNAEEMAKLVEAHSLQTDSQTKLFTEQADQFREQLSVCTSKLTEAENSRAVAEKAVAERDATVVGLSEQLKSLHLKMEQLVDENTTLKDSKDQSDQQCDELKKQLKSSAEQQQEASTSAPSPLIGELSAKLEAEEGKVRDMADKLKAVESSATKKTVDLEAANATLQSQIAAIERKAQETSDMRDRLQMSLETAQMNIAQLETKLKTNGPVGPANAREEELEMQVAFLNSVIADQRRKQEELQAAVDILNSIPAGGANEAINNGRQHRKKDKPAPRMYCDICELFDLHETEDCPTQAMEMEEEQTHTHVHAKRNVERPYCDNCEEFTHWTADCTVAPDGETF